MISARKFLEERIGDMDQLEDMEANCLIQVLQDFADRHVREAFSKASRAAQIVREDGSKSLGFFETRSGISASVDKHSITNAYPKSRYIL